jgi:hypothetical protein
MQVGMALTPNSLARKQSGFDQLAGEHVPGRKSCQLTKVRQVDRTNQRGFRAP